MGLHVSDIAHGHAVMNRAIVLQQKTQRPVQFEITEHTREALTAWITHAKLKDDQFLFPSRKHASPHLSIRQYARVVERWVISIGVTRGSLLSMNIENRNW
ncbi:hypothetical protein [Acidithiobacillus thiooxidans]|uniref:hypothetical protein n=1 Tax=Acidithiobacillus thiooxidans TaxID=930 RepID=UPI0034E97577